MSPQSLSEQISTERLILRKHQLDLAAPMFQAVDRDRERLGQFLPWVAWTKGIHDEREYIEMTLRQWNENKMFDYYVLEGRLRKHLIENGQRRDTLIYAKLRGE